MALVHLLGNGIQQQSSEEFEVFMFILFIILFDKILGGVAEYMCLLFECT